MSDKKEDRRSCVQAWFWSAEWQEKEAQADAHLKAGRYKTFDNVEDMIAYLDGPEPAGQKSPRAPAKVAIRRLKEVK